MSSPSPRPGYTLPVFATAAAVAALRYLQREQDLESVELDLIEPAIRVNIPIEQISLIRAGMALAICRSDPGDNLDLTRHTPVWAVVEWRDRQENANGDNPIEIEAGEGIGRGENGRGDPGIHRYARQLLQTNLSAWLNGDRAIRATLILPEGRRLAQRTSLPAFGVVDGLSLLGTTGISQPLSAPGQLAQFRTILQEKSRKFDRLVFCLGENGLALAQQKGIHPEQLVKTANWLGPMLAEAGIQQVKEILLWGYHGKLIKLAGGIFHTHHDLADGRLEILTAYCGKLGVPSHLLPELLNCGTVQNGLQILRELENESGIPWVNRI